MTLQMVKFDGYYGNFQEFYKSKILVMVLLRVRSVI